MNKSYMDHASTALRRLADPYLGLAVVVVGSLALRVHEMRPVAMGSVGAAILQRDSSLAGVGLLLLAAARLLARPHGNPTKSSARLALSRAVLLVLLLGFVLYEVDVLTYHFFATRLYAQDVVMMAGETEAVRGMIGAGLRVVSRITWWKLVPLVFVIGWSARSALLMLVRPAAGHMPRPRVLVVSACLMLAFGLAPAPFKFGYFGDKALYENVLQRNHDFFNSGNLSPAFRERVLATPPTAVRLDGLGRRLDVIVLVVESLSSYHSKRFSGVNDWTPRLDSIAANETALTDFFANGWTSIGGSIALMGGQVPVVPERASFTDGGSPRFSSYYSIPDPLPAQLAQLGYRTMFLAGGTVDFLDEREWLHRVGFQQVVGGDDARFSAVRVRGPFNAVPDDVLLDVAANEVGARSTDRPFFLTIATYWSHSPFISHDGSGDGEEPVIRGTDAAIGAFYRALDSMGFFERGVLFITGDHRAMAPYSTAEVERFGGSAPARVPAVVATDALDLPSTLDDPLGQVDLRPSLLSVVSDSFSIGPLEGIFLGDARRPARCVLQTRGDARDLIGVNCGTRAGRVTVDGDGTRFTSGDVTPDDQALVLQIINHTRARKPASQAP